MLSMAPVQQGRRSYAQAATPDFSQPVRRSLGKLPSKPLGPVTAPVAQTGDLLLTTGDRQRTLGTAEQEVLLQHVGKTFPGAFKQCALVRRDTAFELCADSCPAGVAAADQLLQGGHLRLNLAGSADPLVLRVGVTASGLAPGVQLLQLVDVPVQLRREGLTAALLLAAGYGPSSFDVLAEGVGLLPDKLQRLCPGVGNGKYFLGYVRTPPADFALELLPPCIVLDGKVLPVRRVSSAPPATVPSGASSRVSPAPQRHASGQQGPRRQLDLSGMLQPGETQKGSADAAQLPPRKGSPVRGCQPAQQQDSSCSSPAPPISGAPAASASSAAAATPRGPSSSPQGGCRSPPRGIPGGTRCRRSPGDTPPPPPPLSPLRGSPRGLAAPDFKQFEPAAAGPEAPVRPSAPAQITPSLNEPPVASAESAEIISQPKRPIRLFARPSLLITSAQHHTPPKAITREVPPALSTPSTPPSRVAAADAAGLDEECGAAGPGSPPLGMVTPAAIQGPFCPGQTDLKKARDSARRERKQQLAAASPQDSRRGPAGKTVSRAAQQAAQRRVSQGQVSLATARPRRVNAGQGGWQRKAEQGMGGSRLAPPRQS